MLLVTARGESFETDYLVEVLRRFPEVRSIHWAVNDTPAEVTNLPSTLLWGEDAIEEELLGLRFRVRPNAFLQTNTEMAERLYELAREYAGLTGTETVYDLYCGIGTIGLALAPGALTRLGCRDLRGVGRVRARERGPERDQRTPPSSPATSASRSRSCATRAGKPDVVVVDPPRAGLAGQGAAADGRAGRGADRLRLVQPDDARLRREGAPARLRLRARARAARRHVPAHAARRDGRAARSPLTRAKIARCPLAAGVGAR